MFVFKEKGDAMGIKVFLLCVLMFFHAKFTPKNTVLIAKTNS
jgi:hypothetical protein